METNKIELLEKTLELKLKKFIQKNSKKSIREIIDQFIATYPEYKKDPDKVYILTAQMIMVFISWPAIRSLPIM